GDKLISRQVPYAPRWYHRIVICGCGVAQCGATIVHPHQNSRDPMANDEPSIGGPVWFITGCSTGFGRELSKILLARGYRELRVGVRLNLRPDVSRAGPAPKRSEPRQLATIPVEVQREGLSLSALQAALRGRSRGRSASPRQSRHRS